MKKPGEGLTEVICAACNGTGFQKVEQPSEPGRKIYPAKCKECLGKGRTNKPPSLVAQLRELDQLRERIRKAKSSGGDRGE
jgi:DnaJ-class molecular chaperone